MGPFVAEPINPYAPPQCATGPLPPRATELDEPIVLRGEINLAHEVLVMRQWKDRPTRWIARLLALAPLSAAACGVYRFSTSGSLQDVLAVVLGLLVAICFWFSTWILLGLLFGACALLGIPYQKSFWALATNAGLRLRGSSGEEFRPWSSFSKMELADELIMLYGQGNQRNLPIVILNIHWCASSLDQDRLLSLLEAKFGSRAAETRESVAVERHASHPIAVSPETADEQPIVLSGLVDLDQLLRMRRLQRQPKIMKFAGIVLVLMITLIGLCHWMSEPRPGRWVEYGFQISILGLLYVACLYRHRIDAWLLQRSYASGRTKPLWTTWKISATGVSMLTESLETHESWSQLQYCGECENMLVLFNPRIFRLHFLPREFATEDQWERLRLLVRRAVASGELVSRETAP